MKKYVVRMTIVSMLAISLPAFAEHGGGHGGGVEIHRGGEWAHGSHDGLFGWGLAIVGLAYIFSTQTDKYSSTPPVVIVNQQPPAAPPQATAQPATPLWYYCDSAKAYYPYVPSCPEAWRVVPAQPPAPSHATQASSPAQTASH